MAHKYDEEQKWLRSEWIGRALKRLGFAEKRRVGTGVEYYLRRKEVEDLAIRIGVKPQQKGQTQQKEQTEQTRTCWICGKPIIEVDEEWAFDASTGKPCHIKCLGQVIEPQKKLQSMHGMLKCQFCGRYFGTRKDLELHISKTHQNKLHNELAKN